MRFFQRDKKGLPGAREESAERSTEQSVPAMAAARGVGGCERQYNEIRRGRTSDSSHNSVDDVLAAFYMYTRERCACVRCMFSRASVCVYWWSEVWSVRGRTLLAEAAAAACRTEEDIRSAQGHPQRSSCSTAAHRHRNTMYGAATLLVPKPKPMPEKKPKEKETESVD